MKKKRQGLAWLLTASLLASASASAVAQSNNVPVPASSADSGRRAVVAIRPVDTSNFATKTEVNNAYNYAASAYNYAGAAYSKADSAPKSWSKYFPGQMKHGGSAGVTGYLGDMKTYIDGNGYVSVWENRYGWIGLGYTYLDAPIAGSTPYGEASFVVYPVGTANGGPANWRTSVSVQCWGEQVCNGVTY